MDLATLKQLKDTMASYSRDYVHACCTGLYENLSLIAEKEADARAKFESAQETYLNQFSVFTRYAEQDRMTQVLYYGK
jgi:hypothetical protein